MNQPPTKGRAFIKGGFGCLLLFGMLAFLAVTFGGQAHIDAGGFVLLFIIGGAIGLVVLTIYNRGRSSTGDK